MRKFVLPAVITILLLAHSATYCFAADPLRKLGRGLANVITGAIEIPKKVYQVTKTEGALKGFTWGWIKGASEAILRTGTGVYEVMTFPIPAPAEYEPMMQPEFVFEGWQEAVE